MAFKILPKTFLMSNYYLGYLGEFLLKFAEVKKYFYETNKSKQNNYELQFYLKVVVLPYSWPGRITTLNQ